MFFTPYNITLYFTQILFFIKKKPIKAGNITLCSQTFDAIGAENCIDHLTIDLPTLVYETNLESFKDILTYKMLLNNSLVEFDVGIPCLASVLDSKMELENGGIQDFEDAANCFGEKIGLKVNYLASLYRNFDGSRRNVLRY